MRRGVVVAALAAAGAGGLTWLVAPNLLVGLRSPRALAWTVLAGVVCLAVGLGVRRAGARPWVAVAAGLVPGVVATGLVVVRPLLSPRSLSEALPVATAPPPSSPTSSPAGSAAPTASARPATERVAGGVLRGLAGHAARGRVTTYRLADGSHVVRFEDVDIGGTPDPEVYLLSGRDRTGKRGGVHLGALKAERGSFNYPLPASFAGTEFTVLVWCERFAVDIAHATQT